MTIKNYKNEKNKRAISTRYANQLSSYSIWVRVTTFPADTYFFGEVKCEFSNYSY